VLDHVPQGDFPMPVLLLVEAGYLASPVIVGVVRADFMDKSVQRAPSPSREARIDGERVIFDAKEEIVLRCGLGSITLKANGKITIKGMEIASRALGKQKIRGGSVDIN
jgi:hypothetical protein